MVASVVVLPLPVGPVMTIMPCGSFNSRRSVASSARRKSELFDDQQPAILRQDTDDGGFPVLRRHDGDADIDVGAPRPQPRGAVLRQTPLGDVEVGDDLDAGNHGLRQHAGRRRHRPQQAVDPHANHKPGGKRLDVNVAGAQFDGFFEQIVDRAHHRRAAGEIAQALDVVFARLRSPRRRSARRRLAPSRWLRTTARSSDVATLIAMSGAEHDLRRALRRHVGRVRDREHGMAIGGPIGEHHASRAGNAARTTPPAAAPTACPAARRARVHGNAPLRRQIRWPTDRQVPRAWPGDDRIHPGLAASPSPSTVVKCLL